MLPPNVSLMKACVFTITGHLSPTETDGDMLGYDLYSSALADILSEPTMQPPICVGLYAQWGSGKSFLLRKLEGQCCPPVRAQRGWRGWFPFLPRKEKELYVWAQVQFGGKNELLKLSRLSTPVSTVILPVVGRRVRRSSSGQ